MSDDGGKKVFEKYTTVDDSTGEVTESHTVYKELQSGEDSYWKCYSWRSVRKICDVNFGILDAVMRRMAYANKGQTLFMDKNVKKEMAAELNISFSTLDRGIRALIKGRALIKQRRSLYMVNPYMFGKGSWPSVMKLREKYDKSCIEQGKSGKLE